MRWRLFRLLGIPLSVDVSWLVVLVLVTWTLHGLFQARVPDLASAVYLVMALAAALAFFGCIVLHELGHAVVARAFGIPIRGISLFLFGGVAEMEEEPGSARGEFFMAIAGPAVTAVLAGALWLLAGLVALPAIAFPLRYLAVINLVLLVFNLVPAFPLDGGRVFRSLLWAMTGSLRRATRSASFVGQAFAWMLIGMGLFHCLGGNVLQGIWMGLIGLFLKGAAEGSYREVIVRQLLRGEHVSRFMNHEPIAVTPTLDLRSWVDEYVYHYHRKLFPVVVDGRLEGVITTKALAQYPRKDWDRHTIGEAMSRDIAALSIASDAEATQALRQMQKTQSSRLLVLDSGRLVGVLSLKDLLHFLDSKLELESEEGSDNEGPGKER